MQIELEERVINYAVMIIELTQDLPDTKTGNDVAGRLLRAGAAPLAHYRAAKHAISADEFIGKLQQCLQNLREAECWVLLIQKSGMLDRDADLESALETTDAMIRIFAATIRSSTKRRSHGVEPRSTELINR